jgi:hypothetical protein
MINTSVYVRMKGQITLSWKMVVGIIAAILLFILALLLLIGVLRPGFLAAIIRTIRDVVGKICKPCEWLVDIFIMG